MQSLQRVNCHDSRAHGHERHGPFTRLGGFGWVGSTGFVSSQSGSWYAAGAKPVCMFWFGYRWDACERWSFFPTGVIPMNLRPLITVGNLGAWSCLDII
jgi:hypothetical protein